MGRPKLRNEQEILELLPKRDWTQKSSMASLARLMDCSETGIRRVLKDAIARGEIEQYRVGKRKNKYGYRLKGKS